MDALTLIEMSLSELDKRFEESWDNYPGKGSDLGIR